LSTATTTTPAPACDDDGQAATTTIIPSDITGNKNSNSSISSRTNNVNNNDKNKNNKKSTNWMKDVRISEPSPFTTHYVHGVSNNNRNTTNTNSNSNSINSIRSSTGITTVLDAIASVFPQHNIDPDADVDAGVVRTMEESTSNYEKDDLYFDEASSFCQSELVAQFPVSVVENCLSPSQLLCLGSVWFQSGWEPHSDWEGTMNSTRGSSSNNVQRVTNSPIKRKTKPITTKKTKPVRLSIKDATQLLQPNDYLRIHHIPRRFTTVHQHDWTKTYANGGGVNVNLNANNTTIDSGSASDDDGTRTHAATAKPGVILYEDFEMGYAVLRKPSGVPVHLTVDNAVENVAVAYGNGLLQRLRRGELTQDQVQLHSPFDDDSILNASQKGNDNNKNNTTTTTAKNTPIHHQHPHPRGKNKSLTSKEAKAKQPPLIYVTAPHRLDQNTSGVYLVATRKPFSAYFAKLLRQKTKEQLLVSGNTTGISGDERNPQDGQDSDDDTDNALIHKTYKCLVCVFNGNNDNDNANANNKNNITSEVETNTFHNGTDTDNGVNVLNDYQQSRDIMVHYLEPSMRAPKTFLPRIPSNLIDTNPEDWAECMLRVLKVGPVHGIDIDRPNNLLATRLWGSVSLVPHGCTGVCEVDIELLTGRTHQIRGQLSASGFPLVGDAHYGGAVPIKNPASPTGYDDSTLMALQCNELSFRLPTWVKNNRKGSVEGKPSKEWKTFSLDDQAAWWSFIASTD
jgi:23S rRNA-/tRNA-specific pseudouridylate synthase